MSCHKVKFLDREKTSRLHPLFLKDAVPASSAYYSEDLALMLSVAVSVGEI